MTWIYHIKNGDIFHGDQWEGTGYSGTGIGRNNPDAERIPNTGPIPEGRYTIGPAHDHPQLGPCVMNLDPDPETVTYGRDLFRIHGDNLRHDASHGCVILGPAIRKEIAASGDNALEVVR